MAGINTTAYTGEAGVVKFSSKDNSSVATIASVRSFTIDQETQAIETTTMSSTQPGARTYLPGLKQFSGSMDLYWRDDSNGQANLFSAIGGGDSVSSAPTAVEFYPSGESTGIKLTGNVIITGLSITANFDGMVEASCTFQGSGALTRTDL